MQEEQIFSCDDGNLSVVSTAEITCKYAGPQHVVCKNINGYMPKVLMKKYLIETMRNEGFSDFFGEFLADSYCHILLGVLHGFIVEDVPVCDRPEQMFKLLYFQEGRLKAYLKWAFARRSKRRKGVCFQNLNNRMQLKMPRGYLGKLANIISYDEQYWIDSIRNWKSLQPKETTIYLSNHFTRN